MPDLNCVEAMNAAMNEGVAFSRKGWNGKGQFVYFVPAMAFPAQTHIAKALIGDKVQYRSYFALKTAQGDVINWQPSSGDLTAIDFFIVQSLGQQQ